MTTAVLCFIVRDGRVLLAMKKRGFGKGWWNGPGGKVEEGEKLGEAVLREVKEEVGITPVDPKCCGVLHFFFEDGTPDWQVHVFRAEDFDGDPAESEEMRPAWFALEEIPYGQMWADDPHWLPLLLEGKRFKGKFSFRDNSTMVSHEVTEL
ncbi:MAG: 8-oxo-dGTP diphosphatase [Patescibacteria group bacterium]|nr:MAG: 8-oxo-dGTP diphosphatase [Patescibacteria group bacterium]